MPDTSPVNNVSQISDKRAEPTIRSGTVLWSLALLLTLVAAAYQERTGPTYPVHTRLTLGGRECSAKLLRSWSDGDQPVVVTVPDPAVRGRVRWRRYPGSDAWHVEPMRRSAGVLQASLPHQPPAGKLE